MNRRERKQIEKKLGLTKYYKTMSREQKWEKLRNNIESGNQMHKETIQRNKQTQEELDEAKMNDIISHNAEKIAKDQKIPMIDALVLAKTEYDNQKVNS